ncbi:hypothetical protein NOL18_25270 [Vibrio parahaemolyticus]|uniref:hypothetical protein n=1 Tax=Vibrio parahaemolyticus TaxID=670 RepID=UPI0022699E3A|nr:hypothetical protein [Vibrio parahaemolyticus]MCX8880417.1 hypothetical protein [Vibrio parahaemolyticus]HCE5300361.1 hypothetical protein [Vibrio parahaemolyticus]
MSLERRAFLEKYGLSESYKKEQSKMALEIEEYKNKLGELTTNKQINYYQKLELYKSVSVPLVDLVANITHQETLTPDYIRGFDKKRFHMTAQLALFASSDVFDMFMDLIDYMYSSIESNTFDFHVFRVEMLKFLSEVRKDIGIYTDEITYKGNR